MNPIIQEVTASQVKKDITPFKVGDGVRVHTKVREGDKERVQVYAGIVIARKGHGIHETFTVRRLSYGEGVERVFPVNSPNIDLQRHSLKFTTETRSHGACLRHAGKGRNCS